ncbi:alpha-hydroxy-acid oxidizing protein [Streptomyces sp. 7R007]
MDGLEQRAARSLPPEIHGYFRRGAGAGLSAAEASTAWDGFRLRPRVLRDVSACDTSTTVLGTPGRDARARRPEHVAARGASGG